MAKEKKFRELSDEELKQVTGGIGFEPKCYPKTSYEGGVCPSSYADKGDECCYGGLEKANPTTRERVFAN